MPRAVRFDRYVDEDPVLPGLDQECQNRKSDQRPAWLTATQDRSRRSQPSL